MVTNQPFKDDTVLQVKSDNGVSTRGPTQKKSILKGQEKIGSKRVRNPPCPHTLKLLAKPLSDACKLLNESDTYECKNSRSEYLFCDL